MSHIPKSEQVSRLSIGLGFAALALLYKPFRPTKLSSINEVGPSPHLPGYRLALQLFPEPPGRGPDWLMLTDYDPNTHHCASCMADAMPVERDNCGRTIQVS